MGGEELTASRDPTQGVINPIRTYALFWRSREPPTPGVVKASLSQAALVGDSRDTMSWVIYDSTGRSGFSPF
jgi:hypothetical protein